MLDGMDSQSMFSLVRMKLILRKLKCSLGHAGLLFFQPCTPPPPFPKRLRLHYPARLGARSAGCSPVTMAELAATLCRDQ